MRASMPSAFFACVENHSINAALWDWLSEGRGGERGERRDITPPKKRPGRYRGSVFYLFCIYDFRKLITASFGFPSLSLTAIQIFNLRQSVQVNETRFLSWKCGWGQTNVESCAAHMIECNFTAGLYATIPYKSIWGHRPPAVNLGGRAKRRQKVCPSE